jgi:hypothetical protein
MKIRTWQMLIFSLVLAGCVDNIDSITREYRNTTNEAIDAMAMCTTEQAAERMTKRIFKPMAARYTAIDKKVSIIYGNRDSKKDFAMQVLLSDGFQLYESDMQANDQRFKLEKARLRNLEAQYVKEKRQELIEQGELDPQVTAAQVCPFINGLASGDVLGPLVKQIPTKDNDPDLIKYKKEFSTWKIDDYPAIFQKYEERRKTFTPQREVRLIR